MNLESPAYPSIGPQPAAPLQETPDRASETLCPLCVSPKTRLSRAIAVEPLLGLWRENYKIDVRPEFRGVSQINFWQCTACALFFFTPSSLTGSPQLYSQLDKFEWYYMPRKWEFDMALQDIRGCKKVLEIGSGSGSFIVLARETLGLEVEGLEQNAKAIAESIRRGLMVRKTTVEEMARQFPASYDAICSFQVLEHVQKPRQFLEACCTLLRPGGLLLLGLPNADSYIRKLANPLDLPPHHMTRWTKACLRNVQHHFPIKLIRTACEPLRNYQMEPYVDAYTAYLLTRGTAVVVRRWLRSRIIRLIEGSGASRFLTGETIYACYARR